jgi:hypothetical protein
MPPPSFVVVVMVIIMSTNLQLILSSTFLWAFTPSLEATIILHLGFEHSSY